MNEKNQFIQFVLGRLSFKSKQDLIENFYIKSITDSYARIDKIIGVENDIRDRFIHDFYHESPILKRWIQANILYVNWERWVFKNEEDLGRTDLSFGLSGFEYIIECKRLKSDSKIYIIDGLYRFINKEYSENECYAGMMGFVISGDTKKISLSLKDKCQKESYCDNDFVKSKLDYFDNTFVTAHYRENSEEINIYHLFFEFDKITKQEDRSINKV